MTEKSTQLLNTYCGFVAIIGRPNVGKSTLLNQLLKQKIAITSCKAQTTRHQILGIDTQDNYQIIYIDTPGLHSQAKKMLNRLMNRAAYNALYDVDLLLFVVEGTKWQDDDELVLNKLKSLKKPVILVINKVDQIKNKQCLLPYIARMQKQYPFIAIIPLSAEKNIQIDGLVTQVKKQLPLGEHQFDADQVTTISEQFLSAEIVREKLIRLLGAELPYALTVKIEQFKEDASGRYMINALILVDRESQKKIIIGKMGEKLKQVGILARKDLAAYFDKKIHLSLWVKVKNGWADDQQLLQQLGYYKTESS